MIYIFGDSWGYSYRNTGPTDEFDGADLADQLENKIQIKVINHCERALSNFIILNRLQNKLEELSGNDIIIILQTDPLRNIFVPWDPNKNQQLDKINDNQLTLDAPTDMRQIYHYLLVSYYTKLKELSAKTKAKIILHGGCSKIDSQLAEEFNLIYTKKSSTEILIPNYQDCYYFDDAYLAWVSQSLKKNNKNYKDIPAIMLEILKQTEEKIEIWQKNQDLFTRNHTTPQGTGLIAEYLADFLKAEQYV